MSLRSGCHAKNRLSTIVAIAWFAVACNEPRPEPTAGSNSNWLRSCQTASDCPSVNACTCGACTLPCATDGDCARLSQARCALDTEPSTRSVCQATQPALAGICLPSCQAGTCGSHQACVESACIPLNLPTGTFCSAVVDRSLANRTHEDEILELLQQSRAAGGVVCGSNAPSAVQPTLRLDARLSCAARVFADDLATTGNQSLTDSQGRDTQSRMTLAGYAQTSWAEGYALRAASASSAYATLLSDTVVCPDMVSATFVDVGVGVAGDVYVVTLGAP